MDSLVLCHTCDSEEKGDKAAKKWGRGICHGYRYISRAIRKGKRNTMAKKLVAYFSASGITGKVAKTLAQAVGADLYEIIPKVPYTKADLDWTNPKSRSSLEMKDPNSRPAIAGRCENLEDYDVIFVGFPIWWYVAPTIINTFLESYCLEGKTVIPFATSGSSGMGETNQKLKPSCPHAKLLEGKVFKASVSVSELMAWAERVKE